MNAAAQAATFATTRGATFATTRGATRAVNDTLDEEMDPL